VDGADSVTVSGSITNLTGYDDPVVVEVVSDDAWTRYASVKIAPGATSYSVVVLAGSAAGEGRVEAFIDRAATGESQSPENRLYEAGARDLNLTQSATVDSRFVPAVVLLGPAAGATRSAPGGTFGWEDCRVTAGSGAPTGDMVYALWFATESSDGPVALYVVPETAASLDLADLSATEEHLDLMPFATSVMSGGQYSLGTDGTSTCSAGSSAPSASLRAGVSYTWAVAVIECTFPDFSSAASVNDFNAGAAQAFGGEDSLYAMSEERELSVQ
jgi:hypothetical protein